jgi:hypothetical protein
VLCRNRRLGEEWAPKLKIRHFTNLETFLSIGAVYTGRSYGGEGFVGWFVSRSRDLSLRDVGHWRKLDTRYQKHYIYLHVTTFSLYIIYIWINTTTCDLVTLIRHYG